MAFYIYPYHQGSRTAKELSKLLPAKRIKLQNSKFVATLGKTVINWGNSHCPIPWALNCAGAVQNATNKADAFRLLTDEHVPCPEWTLSQRVAISMLAEGTKRLIARTVLRGHGGNGIKILTPESEMVKAPLYTVYWKKEREFRVIVVKNQVVDVLEKIKRNGAQKNGHDEYIRSHGGYWVFARGKLVDNPVPADVSTIAIQAVAALGLDFGGVDMGYNTSPDLRGNTCCVFEVNTAPGMEGTTLVKFADAIRSSYA